MRLHSVTAALAIAAAFACGSARAQTEASELVNSFESDSDGYNLIAFGSASLSQDVQGGVAVGSGGLTIAQTTEVGSDASVGSNPTLYDQGGLTFSGGDQIQVEAPTAYLPGLNQSDWTWTAPHTLTENETSYEVLINGSGQSGNPITSGSAPANWSSMQSNLASVSSSLSAAASNPSSIGAIAGTISVSGQNLTFSASGATAGSVVVFDLDAADFSGGEYNGQAISGIDLDFSAGIDYVIDVTGISGSSLAFLSGLNFVGSSSSYASQTLWNFEDTGSTSIAIDSSSEFYGSILAPDVSVTGDTTLDGQVVSDDFVDGSGGDTFQVDAANFSPVNLPESGAFAWWAAGLCAAAVAFRLRGLRSRPS